MSKLLWILAVAAEMGAGMASTPSPALSSEVLKDLAVRQPGNHDLVVSPNGDDRHPGTLAQPLATLAAARDRLRREGNAAGRTVWLAGGTYSLSTTFELGDVDSGAADAPVVYRALPGESACLQAGRRLRATDFTPVAEPGLLARLDPAARGQVVALDLASAGVRQPASWPDVFSDGGGLFELYCDGRRMPLSRWPNTGYTTMQAVVDNGVWQGPARRGGKFVYRDDRPVRWQAAVADGLWLDGFWRVPWQPEKVRVAAIDPAIRTITHAQPVNGGIGSKYSKVVDGLRVGDGKEKWLAVNLLEEIDQPGEWCINFRTGTLFFWPPRPVAAAVVMIADLGEPVVRIKGASHVIIAGLTVEGGLGDGLVVEDGVACGVIGCTVRNQGGNGVVVRGGANDLVRSCLLHDLGHGGIVLSGGDRKTLVPAGHAAENNHIHHVGCVKKTYAPAILLGSYGTTSVGNRVAHNLIHDLPHAAVLYGGNDNLLECNEIYRVAMDSGDVGAFYTWYDWTSRGNIVRWNYVHDSPGANGVYLDDGDSGDLVLGNIFCRTACGPFVGGGHDNLVRGNVSIECAVGLHLDDRGVARGYNAANSRLVGGLNEVNYLAPPWSERYPELTTILENHPDWPTGTVIADNLTVKCGTPLRKSGKLEHFGQTRIEGNVDLAAPAPELLAAGPDQARRAATALQAQVTGSQPIPTERIALQPDPWGPPSDASSSTGHAAASSAGEVFDSETDLHQSNREADQR